MKRIVLFLTGTVLLAGSVLQLNAQDVLTEVYTREHIRNKKPVPYGYVREADVMWAKDIYRIIDLRQKQNLPLFYPINPIADRMNLTDLLLHSIDNEGVRAFSTTDPKNEFTIPMTREQIDEAFGAGVEIIKVEDVNNPGTFIDQESKKERSSSEVQQIMVKEKWFFDKNHSVMKVRIVGLCPIRVYNQLDDQGMPTELVLRKKTFWVYFDEVRPVLASHEVFNRNNDAQRISFDDFLWQRRFDSFIIAESNVYDNRQVSSYSLGLDAQLESEKIKESIFNTEHDLWEY
ncbi:MAG: gliding motility protein GldN [Bacteroidales bacterium]|nr:gliding motility protein GldN [Bacteroidales bacterium]